MPKGEKLWERLKAADTRIWESPVAGGKELHDTLSQLAKIRNPPLELRAFAEKIRGRAIELIDPAKSTAVRETMR